MEFRKRAIKPLDDDETDAFHEYAALEVRREQDNFVHMAYLPEWAIDKLLSALIENEELRRKVEALEDEIVEMCEALDAKD